MTFRNLTFEPVSKNNLDLITTIQNKIFPGEDASQNYIETIERDPYRKELANWLVLLGGKVIGIVGLYSYHEYPKTSWLGWFGVLEEERGKKYGSTIFDFWIDYSRKQGYSEARLYTDKLSNQSALQFYEHKGMLREDYKNENEDREVRNNMIIFSKSLTSEPINKWNNKFLEISDQIKKQG